ncbi:hypothetical protein OVS_03150 [Mycoplasma ovis str. Michigan]|uniref:Hypoxanthine-guanine phosphoribosyltransferase n=1 Tax=Mycoplasma ovis str. Michigan TaxID=1415773 RepID=A0ABM5P1Q5_9MOLU|nr:phosphoribosyltransferase family protein [Mycoplasma ovis]AHC40384.1 hypothetical protein OVS_03150 [Mycoplasma ovis str. Michigan]
MQFTSPLAIGVTSRHWVNIFEAHLDWARVNQQIDDHDYNTTVNQLKTFSSEIPESSFENFKTSIRYALSGKASDILSKIPESFAFHLSQSLVVKENNSVTLRSYYQYRNVVRDMALQHKNVLQKLNGKVTTVGYQFSLFYNTLSDILEKFILSRRYLEIVNAGSDLSHFIEDYSLNQLDFIAKKLELFNVSTFASSNQNGFVASAKDLSRLSKGMINYVKHLHSKGQLDSFDNELVNQIQSSADSVISFNHQNFDVDFDTYSSLFIQTNNAFSGTIRILQSIKLREKDIEKEVSGVNQGQIEAAINSLFSRIFDKEKKREVLGKIFFEAPEMENMIYRLAQQINNEYRDSKNPVCCVGFTEGAIVLLGKIIPLFNFPLYLVTYKISLYGSEVSGDATKEIDVNFDNYKYDGNRVLVFDDILNIGLTVTKFIEQARKKTKAIDFKVCVLFKKPNEKNIYGDADFSGSSVSDEWLVGFGLDSNFQHRNIDATGTLKESPKDN